MAWDSLFYKDLASLSTTCGSNRFASSSVKTMNECILPQTEISSMAISTKRVWIPLALDSSWSFSPSGDPNAPHSSEPFIQLAWDLTEHLRITYFHKTLKSDYVWDLCYLVNSSKNWLVSQTNPRKMEERGKREHRWIKKVIQAWPLTPHFLGNEFKSLQKYFKPTLALSIAMFQSKANWRLGKSSKSFQQGPSSKPFCPCALLKVSL